MENLYFNLAEEEFSRSRKILLIIFAGLFFLAGSYILFANLFLGKESMHIAVSTAPFSISIVVFVILLMGSVKRKNQFFIIDNDKIEFRFGFFRPKKHSFQWTDIHELVLPHKQKKALFRFTDGSVFILDLTWLQKKKSNIIRKHIYHVAWEKNLKVEKVNFLS
ncbi:MAG TPA: hypothetical protein VK213_09125 [Bacteroidales bacterium]|nr:hypothetical protein [Bacteroidales bacterium]